MSLTQCPWTAPFYKFMCSQSADTGRIKNIFLPACVPHALVSVHLGDAIKPKVTFFCNFKLNQTKECVGESRDSSRLFERVVIILGSDFLFNVITPYRNSWMPQCKRMARPWLLPDNQSCFVLIELLLFLYNCEALCFRATLTQSKWFKHAGQTAQTIKQHWNIHLFQNHNLIDFVEFL